MLKIGIVGCGFMGGMHAACYNALAALDVQVTALADPRTEFAKKLAGKETIIYETGMDLIANADVDVVDICLPTDLHAAHAVAAMRAGKHVFIEKPITLDEADMDLLLKTEAETGVKVQVGQVIRHWSEYAWLKGVVDAGTYGSVLSAVFKRLSALPQWASEGWLLDPARSGGVAVDMHVHDTDFVRYLLGEPEQIKSQAYRDENGVIQHIMSLFSYGGRVAVSVEACWDYPQSFPFTADYRVKFEHAVAVLRSGVLTVYPNGGEPFHPALAADYQGDNDIGGNVSSLGGYYNELKYFVEGIAGKNDLSIATISEAIASTRLVLREVEAAGGLVRRL